MRVLVCWPGKALLAGKGVFFLRSAAGAVPTVECLAGGRSSVPLIHSPPFTRKHPTMRVDIYRRPEADNKFSHLAVPEGKPIPQEATNIDWQSEHQDVEMDENAPHWDDYGIARPGQQLAKKGYAITGLHEQTEE